MLNYNEVYLIFTAAQFRGNTTPTTAAAAAAAAAMAAATNKFLQQQ